MKTRLLLILSLLILSPLASADRDAIAPSADTVTPLLNGMRVPDVTVKTVDGDPVSLRAIVMQKPTLILFYRGGWCPYCNRQLAGIKNIEADLTKLGYQILAISPQSGEQLKEQALKTEMDAMLYTEFTLVAGDRCMAWSTTKNTPRNCLND